MMEEGKVPEIHIGAALDQTAVQLIERLSVPGVLHKRIGYRKSRHRMCNREQGRSQPAGTAPRPSVPTAVRFLTIGTAADCQVISATSSSNDSTTIWETILNNVYWINL